MNGGRNAINQTKPIEADERQVFRVGETLPPGDGAEVEQTMGSDAALRQDGFSKAKQIRRRSVQRRRSHETAEALPPVDQSLVHEDFIARVTVKRLTPNLLAN